MDQRWNIDGFECWPSIWPPHPASWLFLNMSIGTYSALGLCPAVTFPALIYLRLLNELVMVYCWLYCTIQY